MRLFDFIEFELNKVNLNNITSPAQISAIHQHENQDYFVGTVEYTVIKMLRFNVTRFISNMLVK